MLDPRIKLGTSTPGADPSGDYAWEVFSKAEALRPGARAMLEAKALTLTGGREAPAPSPDGRSVYTVLLARSDADIFLTARADAARLVAFILSTDGQTILARHGFASPSTPHCTRRSPHRRDRRRISRRRPRAGRSPPSPTAAAATRSG